MSIQREEESGEAWVVKLLEERRESLSVIYTAYNIMKRAGATPKTNRQPFSQPCT